MLQSLTWGQMMLFSGKITYFFTFNTLKVKQHTRLICKPFWSNSKSPPPNQIAKLSTKRSDKTRDWCKQAIWRIVLCPIFGSLCFSSLCPIFGSLSTFLFAKWKLNLRVPSFSEFYSRNNSSTLIMRKEGKMWTRSESWKLVTEMNALKKLMVQFKILTTFQMNHDYNILVNWPHISLTHYFTLHLRRVIVPTT